MPLIIGMIGAAIVGWIAWNDAQWKRVWGTSFRPQGTTHKGPRGDYKYEREDILCALPCYEALGKWVLIRNTATGKTIKAFCQDVGPWYVWDLEYVFGGAKPLAELAYELRTRLTTETDSSGMLWTTLELLYGYAREGFEAAKRMLAQRERLGDEKAAKCPRLWRRVAKQRAGIDISWRGWEELGVPQERVENWSGEVEWKFI